jgi:histone H3/H4
MAARTTILPKAAVATIFLDAGAPRVSKEAVAELVDELQRRAVDISTKAWRIAQHSGRKTVTGPDIKVARH